MSIAGLKKFLHVLHKIVIVVATIGSVVGTVSGALPVPHGLGLVAITAAHLLHMADHAKGV